MYHPLFALALTESRQRDRLARAESARRARITARARRFRRWPWQAIARPAPATGQPLTVRTSQILERFS